jgi:hypothetical protein
MTPIFENRQGQLRVEVFMGQSNELSDQYDCAVLDEKYVLTNAPIVVDLAEN